MVVASCEHSGAYNLKRLIAFIGQIYMMFEIRAVVRVNATVFMVVTPCGFLRRERAAVYSVGKYRVYKKNLTLTRFMK
jgi:hypothetical protein